MRRAMPPRESSLATELDMAYNPAEPRDTAGKWYHGTHLAGLKPGDLIEPGHQKNWGYSDPQHISISSNPHGALGYGHVAAAEHGMGLRAGHVYEVAPTGLIEQDKNSIGRGDETENRQTTGARVVRELSPAEALTIRWQQQGWGDPPADLLKKAGSTKEAELSNDDHCSNCGCPRPDSITDQIELGWHFNPAEHRDAHGRWTRGATVPGQSLTISKLWDVHKAIDDEWRKSSVNSPEGLALNRASAWWDANDHENTVIHLRDAAREATAAGHDAAASRYQNIAAKIETYDQESRSLETPVRELASAAVPAVDRMIGGRSAYTGKVYTWSDDDPQYVGVAAEMRWDGTMGARAELAREIQRTQADQHAQIMDPVQYQDVLHELIHAELPPGESYQKHAPAYGKSPEVQAIEEGFTELGAHHHAHEFFDAIGVGKRETQVLAEGLGGYPVPNPAYRRAVSTLAANLQAGYVKLSAIHGHPSSRQLNSSATWWGSSRLTPNTWLTAPTSTRWAVCSISVTRRWPIGRWR